MDNIKILVIEDDEVTRKLLDKVLSKEGYNVLIAESGEIGLDIFKKESPHIVLTDLNLPGINGLELIHSIKKHSPNLQVILTTSRAEFELAVQAIREGVLDYLKKPINLNELSLALGRAKKNIKEYKLSLTFPTILLVEDEKSFRSILSLSLIDEGWRVLTAKDGFEAIQIFKDVKVDIAVLDINMPGKNGLDTLKEMRELSHDFEAIILSGIEKDSYAVEAMRSGAINYLNKLEDRDKTIDVIKEAIDKLYSKRVTGNRGI